MEEKAKAKIKALKDLKKMVTGMIGGDVKNSLEGMKKVTVAASDEEGLKKGLKKAEEIMGSSEEECEPEDEMMESEDMEENEEESSEEMSPEEIKAKIAELQAKLAKK